MRSRTRLLLTLCSLLGVGVYLAAQSQIRYVYDELGRLVGVIDQNGDAAAYHYDPVGNLLSITRTGPSQVAIIEFTPNDGPIGGSITIHGTGFSTTLSQNTVTFNGTAATVVSATANRLVVTVPGGATSGPLSITTPNGNTSAAFVISTVAMPAITGLSSTIAVSGASITITGTAFEPVPTNNNVSFNVSYAALASATTTQIGTAVPPGATSGRITVATPRGNAVSTQDFFVPPPPNVAADVLVADRIAFAQDKVVSLGTANKIALLLVDLVVGQRASLSVTSGTTPLSAVSIRDPYGRVAGSVSVVSTGFIDTIKATVPGTHTVIVDPASTYTGNNTLRLHDVPADVTGAIATDGTAVVVTTTVPGQNGRLTFTGVSAQRVSARLTSSTITNRTMSILDPAGATVASTVGAFIDTQTLSTPGQHSLFLDPYVGSTGSMTVALYEVPADVTGTIAIGGSAVPVNITTPGQNGLLTFSGSAGQRISLTLNAGALTSGLATMRKPDQSTLASANFGNGTTLLEPVTLPDTGTYSIFVDPSLHTTGTVSLTLNAVPADITGAIVAGGSPVLVTLTAPGQKARLTFTGTAGQRVSLHGTSGPAGTLALLKPDDTTLASTSTGVPAAFIDVKILPSAGTYTVLVDPLSANTGSITVTLYNVPADVTGTVTVGGTAVAVTTTVPGQNGSLTFSGTASQQVTVRITGNTMGLVTVKLLRPDGTTMTTTSSSSASFNLAAQTLPTTGTYTITIDPSQTNTGTMNVQVTNP